jgi:hypothetical protein
LGSILGAIDRRHFTTAAGSYITAVGATAPGR